MKQLWQLLGLLVVTAGISPLQAHPAINLSQLQQICLQSYPRCVDASEAALKQIQPQSRLWYEVQLLKLDAMFSQQSADPLFALTSEFIKDKTAPTAFLARIYIYHAKLLYAQDQKPQSKFYLDKAVTLMSGWQQSTEDPMSYIRLYNVQLYAGGNYQHGYDQLAQLEKRYQGSQDARLQYELQNNLGHFANYLQQPDTALRHRQQALGWAEKMGPPALVAEAHFNLARISSRLGLWQDADRHFAAAFDHYGQAEEPIAQTESKMYRAEALWQLHRHAEAIELLRQTDLTLLPQHRQDDLQRIRLLLQR
ncbi:MAG: tetratricopeptide repeat protein [Rheinheimera sp.]|nr:tetratricopeptide repeat protein [Rheinheimera sp.]